MVDYMQAHAIGGPWPAGERILVCINEHPSSAELVRRARRIADGLKAPWTRALYRGPAPSFPERSRKGPRRRHAAPGGSALGADTATLPGRDIAADDPGISRAGTMSRRSSSANPNARAGSNCCTVRSCAISCATAAPSASPPSWRAATPSRQRPSRPRRSAMAANGAAMRWSALAVAGHGRRRLGLQRGHGRMRSAASA